jgi:ribosomal protein S18 acetylase RimI-like enzyme
MTATTAAIRPYRADDESEVLALWHRCGLVHGNKDPLRDIEAKLEDGPDLLLVADLDGRVVGTVMPGWDGHRGWIHYLAVDPDLQRGGLGRALMAEAERLLHAVGCRKVNLQVRATNGGVVPFYERLGFSIEERISMGKRLD